MGSFLAAVRRISYPSFLAVYLLWAVTGAPFFRTVFGIFLIGLVLQAIPDSSRVNRIVALILFSAGIACLSYSGASRGEWLTALTNNGGLVALFIVLPLFSFILSYHDYRTAIKNIFQAHIRTGAGFTILAAWLSYILAVILNVASIHMLYSLLSDNAESYGVKKGFHRALVRGNMAGVFWAPNFMAVAIVLTYVKLPWLEIAPLGFLLSFLVMLVISGSFLLGRDKGQKPHFLEELSQEKETSSRKLMYHLLVVYLGLILLVILLNTCTNYEILTIVALTALVYPPGLALVEGKTAQFRQELKGYLQKTLPGIKNEVLLFASVGFFGKALDITGVGPLIFSCLPLNSLTHPSLAIVVIIVLMTILSVFGVHPIVSISAFATSIEYGNFGLSAQAFAYTLMQGYSTAVIASPFSAISLVMAGVSGQNPWETPKLNTALALAITLLMAFLLPLV